MQAGGLCDHHFVLDHRYLVILKQKNPWVVSDVTEAIAKITSGSSQVADSPHQCLQLPLVGVVVQVQLLPSLDLDLLEVQQVVLPLIQQVVVLVTVLVEVTISK